MDYIKIKGKMWSKDRGVGESHKYLSWSSDGETGSIWILMESRLSILYKDPKKAKFEVLEKMKGASLTGLEYEPLFNFFESVSEHIA